MSQPHPPSADPEVVPITCLYCKHRWQEPVAELEQKKRVIYRHDPTEEDPEARREYLVQCPNCGRRMTVTIRVKGV